MHKYRERSCNVSIGMLEETEEIRITTRYALAAQWSKNRMYLQSRWVLQVRGENGSLDIRVTRK